MATTRQSIATGTVVNEGKVYFKTIVQNGQNVFDAALMYYGTLEKVFTIFALNPDIDINTDLQAQQVIVVDRDDIGDQKVYDNYLLNDYITNNADEDFASTEGDKQFQDGEFAKFQNNEFYKYN